MSIMKECIYSVWHYNYWDLHTMVFRMAEFQVHQQGRLVVEERLETEVHTELTVVSFEVSVLDMLDEITKRSQCIAMSLK